jgi:flagellar basal-body rod modification protein FlgD
MASSIIPPTAFSANTTSSNAANSSSSSSSSGSVIDQSTIAGNFTAFLQLLTTQLQNQNPLDPLDTNQFTQQLVEFAGVEQQLKSNQQLATLVSLQQTAQSTQALSIVGATVAVDGSTAQLANNQARWSFSVTKPAMATITISSANGQTAYTGTFAVQAGTQQFAWDGKGNDGTQWPSGSYKMTVTATDANGQTTGVSTEVDGVVDSVDLTQNPPMLSIGGQNFTLNQIKRVMAPSSSS